MSDVTPEGRGPEAHDRLRRRVLWALPTGLYVIGSRGAVQLDGAGQPDETPRYNLMTASLVVQVATRPKLVAAAIESGAVTNALVSEAGCFTVSLLSRDDRALVRKFAKPVAEVSFDAEGRLTEMAGMAVRLASTGTPVLARAVAFLDCEVRERLDLGSHVLYVGQVVDVGGTEGTLELDEDLEVLRMEDTRMNYGG